jgi:hypothetical protein
MPLPFTLPQFSQSLPSIPQIDLCCRFSVLDSPHADPELSQWLGWAS